MSELSKLRKKCNQCFDLHRHQCIKEYDCEIDKKMSELQEQQTKNSYGNKNKNISISESS